MESLESNGAFRGFVQGNLFEDENKDQIDEKSDDDESAQDDCSG